MASGGWLCCEWKALSFGLGVFRKLPRGCDQDDPTITGADDDDDDGKPSRGRSAIKACAPRSGRGIECVWLLLDFADFAEAPWFRP